MKVSIVIKALNEERNIARAIESSLDAIRHIGEGEGEVVLADSHSTDRTIEIAENYPIRIVRLRDPKERCCGVGAEIGYRVSQGKYIYILDADMEINGFFLEEAVRVLDLDPTLAGVGGQVEEMNLDNAEFRGRAAKLIQQFRPGDTDRLNMGGLYRTASIEKIGYLTNRNLHALEEFELGVRLISAGFRLTRIDCVAVRHYGHTDSSMRLLLRRWKSRYIWGGGELLRNSIGKSHFFLVLRKLDLYFKSGVVYFWWLVLFLSFVFGLFDQTYFAGFMVCLLFPFLAAFIKRRSMSDGLYLIAFFNLSAAGVLAGVISSPRGSPEGDINYEVLK